MIACMVGSGPKNADGPPLSATIGGMMRSVNTEVLELLSEFTESLDSSAVISWLSGIG